MHVYRQMDRRQLQFDFVSHQLKKGDYDDEIHALGGSVYRIESLGQVGMRRYIQSLKAIMETRQYCAVHAHTDYQSGFPAYAAKRVGVPIRICHSHANYWDRQATLTGKASLKLLQSIIRFSATDYCACSVEAARFLFGERKLQDQVHILKNGIPINSFLEAGTQREQYSCQLKQTLQLSQTAVLLGQVGRLSTTKNQTFTLHLIKACRASGLEIYGLFVGAGSLKAALQKEAEALGIAGHIRFLGVRSDMPRLMAAFDCVLLPSISEGFGMVAIEAQCAGTPCIASDQVPRATDTGVDLITYLPLKADINRWVQVVAERSSHPQICPKTIHAAFSQNGFDIGESLSQWLHLYGVTAV
ncbi:putative glycosyltransferase EpsF [Pullulanibacillus camelliae]|uniref:Putative glycosyltransferase EpsF n=2 Tax=Pullulanibacillus camelliae TaxID=1707096 RepID=A0A8J2YFU6_9BACL|nr:putative glycosyltransferase EpsF [Pullulanibacillus camelliae]